MNNAAQRPTVLMSSSMAVGGFMQTSKQAASVNTAIKEGRGTAPE